MKPTTQTLKQLPTTLVVEKVEGRWELNVVIVKPNETPAIKYDDISLRGLDDQGKEFNLRKLDEKAEMFIEVNSAGTTANGFYSMELKGSRKPASIEVSRGGEKRTFKFGVVE